MLPRKFIGIKYLACDCFWDHFGTEACAESDSSYTRPRGVLHPFCGCLPAFAKPADIKFPWQKVIWLVEQQVGWKMVWNSMQRKCLKEEHQALYNSKMYFDYHHIFPCVYRKRTPGYWIATSLLAVTHRKVNWWTLNIYARMYAIDNTWIVYHPLKVVMQEMSRTFNYGILHHAGP